MYSNVTFFFFFLLLILAIHGQSQLWNSFPINSIASCGWCWGITLAALPGQPVPLENVLICTFLRCCVLSVADGCSHQQAAGAEGLGGFQPAYSPPGRLQGGCRGRGEMRVAGRGLTPLCRQVLLCKCTCAASRACWTLKFEWGHSVLPCCHLPQHPRVTRPCREPAQVAVSLFCCLPREPGGLVCWSREPFGYRLEEWRRDRGMLLAWGSFSLRGALCSSRVCSSLQSCLSSDEAESHARSSQGADWMSQVQGAFPCPSFLWSVFSSLLLLDLVPNLICSKGKRISEGACLDAVSSLPCLLEDQDQRCRGPTGPPGLEAAPERRRFLGRPQADVGHAWGSTLGLINLHVPILLPDASPLDGPEGRAPPGRAPAWRKPKAGAANCQGSSLVCLQSLDRSGDR